MEKLIEEIARKHSMFYAGMASDVQKSIAAALREFEAAQNAAGQAAESRGDRHIARPDTDGSYTALEPSPAPAAPTERQLDSFGRDLREANLTTMVKRLAHCLREDNEKLRNQAFDLLKRMDLLGPPLRSGSAERRIEVDPYLDHDRRTGPQDRRQAPQPSTAGFPSAPSTEDVGQGGIAGTAGEDAELLLAREMMESHYPSHNEYKVAALAIRQAARIETLARELDAARKGALVMSTAWAEEFKRADKNRDAAAEAIKRAESAEARLREAKP